MGVTDPVVQQGYYAGTMSGVGLMRNAGLNALAVKVFWSPGMTEPSLSQRAALSNVAAVSRMWGTPHTSRSLPAVGNSRPRPMRGSSSS